MSAKRGIEQGKSPQKRQRLELGRESSIEEKPSGPEKVFRDLLSKASADDVVWEYNLFLNRLSYHMTQKRRNEVIDKVGKLLQVGEAKKILAKNDPSARPRFTSQSVNETPLLDALSNVLGSSLIFITPPTLLCIYCRC